MLLCVIVKVFVEGFLLANITQVYHIDALLQPRQHPSQLFHLNHHVLSFKIKSNHLRVNDDL